MTSFLSKRSEDPQTIGMLITAAEYAVAAVERMLREATRDAQTLQRLLENYVDVVFSLEVSFTFPLLPSGERDLLVALMKTRNALGVQLNGLQQWRTSQQKAEHDQVTADLKEKFVRLQSEVLATGIQQHLDERQKRVLTEEYLSIPLDKLNSTSLFFEPSLTDRPHCVPPGTGSCRAQDRSPALNRVPAPRMPARPHPRHLEGREGRAPVPRRTRQILLLDRDERLTSEVSRTLSLAGYQVVVADNGFDGYSRAANLRPDLILLGPGLLTSGPDPHRRLDGAVILKMLSRLSKDRSIPLVVICSDDDCRSKEAALAAGAVTCLRAQVNRDQLIDVVRKVLKDTPDAAAAG